MAPTAEQLRAEARALRLAAREHDQLAWEAEDVDDGQVARHQQRIAASLRARADRAWWRAVARDTGGG